MREVSLRQGKKRKRKKNRKEIQRGESKEKDDED